MKTPVCARIVVLQKLEMLWIELPTTCELSPRAFEEDAGCRRNGLRPVDRAAEPEDVEALDAHVGRPGAEGEAVLVGVALAVDLGAQSVPRDEGHELT